MAIILITHDLGVVAEMADDVIVMYAGAAVEKAPRRELFASNHHPYTEGLLLSLPRADTRERLRPIAGQPPSLITLPQGCKFNPRCPYVMDQCRREEPVLQMVQGRARHTSACWLPHDLADRQARREAVVG